MRREWFAVGAVATTLLGSMMASCSGDDTSLPIAIDASVDADVGVAFDAYDVDTSFDAGLTCPACFMGPDLAIYRPYGAPSRHAGVCSDEDITAFLDACIAGDGLDATKFDSTCDPWLAAHPACASCIGDLRASDAGPPDAGPDAEIPWPALAFLPDPETQSTIVNVNGCLLADTDAGDDCRFAASKLPFCVEQNCFRCDSDTHDSCIACSLDPSYTNCLAEGPDPACQHLLDARRADAGSSCEAPDGGFVETLARVSRVLCGP